MLEANCIDENSLAGYLTGHASSAEAQRIKTHLLECAACRELSQLVNSSPSFDSLILLGRELQVLSSAGNTEEVARRCACDLPAGTSLGRYVIESILGTGSMGMVLAGYDPELKRNVALKVLLDLPTALGAERLVAEAQTLARLSHPNVVAVFDVGRVEDEVFVAMELLEGRTLATWLRDTGPSVAQILEAFQAAALGLSAAHKAGIVHRDFKPGNLFIESSGRVCVTDFGLAHFFDHTPASPTHSRDCHGGCASCCEKPSRPIRATASTAWNR